MSDTPTSSSGYPGQAWLNANTSEFNKISFLVSQMLGLVRTCTVGQVKEVTNTGGLSPVGFLDFQPIVNLVDGALQASEHGTVYQVPYFRLQGGKNAIIIDPEVGDIGIIVVSDRDISTVKSTKAAAAPGSRRRFSFSDAIYIGGILNDTPEQYVQFNADGMKLADKNGNTITMSSSGVDIVSAMLTHNSVNIGSTHTHSAVQTGGGISGPPVP